MAEEEIPQYDERDDVKVRRWRYREAKRLGLSSFEARCIEDSSADLNELRKLLRSGCPPETAVRILV